MPKLPALQITCPANYLRTLPAPVTSALWATPLGETQGEGITPGTHTAHLGSPLRHPTGVSVAALCSPARTGRATSKHPPPSSAPPPLDTFAGVTPLLILHRRGS